MEKQIHAVIATFRTAPDIYHASERVRDAGYTRWDAYSPFPVHGIQNAMGLKRSKVPIFTFVGGVLGFVTGFLMVSYMNLDYPLIVGGKPIMSPVFPFPIFYEMTILFAAFGTLGGMFITNLLPRHHHPVFDFEPFLKTSDDTFMLAIEAEDPAFDSEKVKNFLESIGGESVALVETEEDSQT